MVVTFFDTVVGFSAYNTLVETDRGPVIEQTERYRSQPILDNSILVMPRRTRGLVVISRYAQRGVTVTWFGLYKPLPARMSSRGGSYCGVGIYVADRTAPSASVIRTLEALLDGVTAGMEAEGPGEWRSKEAYDRALDRHSPLDLLQGHLSGARVTGGIDPSGSGCCVVDLDSSTLPLSDIADEAQDGDGFGAFQRLLIVRDEEAFLAVNRRVVTVVDARGGIRDRPSSARPAHPGPSKARNLAAADPEVQPRPFRPASKLEPASTDRAAFADEVRRHRVSASGVALALGILNSGILCALAVERALPRLEAVIWPETAEASAAGSAAPSPVPTVDLRSGDSAKPAAGRSLTDQQLKSVSDTVGRLLNDDTVQKTPVLKSQLEQVRDMLRPALSPPVGRSEVPR